MTIRPDGRIIAYVDGHNMYHGLVEKGFRRYLWLDYGALIRRKVRPGQELVGLKYFTAVVTTPPERRQRHLHYLRALREHSQLIATEGIYQQDSIRCPRCSASFKRPCEKQTDVALATSMLADAYEGQLDVAFLVSADSDQIPAVRRVRGLGVQVVVWSPPRRKSDELVAVADAHLHFTRADLCQSQLPDPVSTRKGKELWRPPAWT